MIHKKIDTSNLSEEQKVQLKAAIKGRAEQKKKIKELALNKDRAGLESMGVFLPETFYQDNP